MRVGHREFKPSLGGTVAAILMLPVLIGLGIWQLNRANEKRALIAEFGAGATTTQRLDRTTSERLLRLQQVEAHGSYDSQRQILLDNMPAPSGIPGQGPGYEVLTPFTLDDGGIVLVNRGWVSLGRSRKELPTVDVMAESRTIRGRLGELPRPGIRMQASESESAWPRVLNFPTEQQLRSIFGDKLLPRIVLLDPSEPDGYARDWTSRLTFQEFGPERHVAYAVQWFGLAFTVAVIYVVVSLKRNREIQ